MLRVGDVFLGCWDADAVLMIFVGSVFGSVFGWMIIGAGVYFFGEALLGSDLKGRSTSKIGLFCFFEQLSFSRFSSLNTNDFPRLLLWPMTIMMMRSCIEHH